MPTYERDLKSKSALDRLVKALETFNKQYELKDTPLYEEAFKLMESANKERRKNKNHLKDLQKIMED